MKSLFMLKMLSLIQVEKPVFMEDIAHGWKGQEDLEASVMDRLTFRKYLPHFLKIILIHGQYWNGSVV